MIPDKFAKQDASKKCVRGASRMCGAAVVCCAVAMTAALAQTAPQPAKRTPTAVVTVTGSPMPLATESASVSLIPQDEIETSQAEDAAELLGQSAFVNVEQQGGDMAFTTMTVRGGKPNQVLVMIDGIPVNDLSNLLGGAFDFSSLALSNVERVEMVRGPMSSVYGSEAVSGVVNFITKRGARPATWTLDDGFGSFGAAQASGANRGAAGRMSYAVDAALSRIGEQTGNDGASLYTGDADLNVPVDARRVWTLVSRYAARHANEFPTGSGGPEYAVNRAAETDRTGELVAGSSWQHQVNDVWLYRVDGNLFRRTAYNYTPPILDGTPPGPASLPSSDGHTRFSRVELRGSNLFTLGRHWSARAGGGWRRESGVSTSVLYGFLPDDFELVRNTGESSAEIGYVRERLTATVGVGTSSTPGFGTVGSPRAGASYQLTATTRMKASYGRSFDLPSFYAYAEPLVGNKNLLPERLQAWDAGVEQRVTPHVELDGTWFHDHYDNLITFSAAEFKLVNLNAVTTQGVELESKIELGKVDAHAWASYLNWKVEGSTEPLRNQPHGQGGVSLDWRATERLMVGGAWSAVGARYDYEVPVPQMDKAGAYSTTTLRAQWHVRSKLTAHVRIENAFDQSYAQFVGFPDPGIRVRVGLKWSFARQRGGQ